MAKQSAFALVTKLEEGESLSRIIAAVDAAVADAFEAEKVAGGAVEAAKAASDEAKAKRKDALASRIPAALAMAKTICAETSCMGLGPKLVKQIVDAKVPTNGEASPYISKCRSIVKLLVGSGHLAEHAVAVCDKAREENETVAKADRYDVFLKALRLCRDARRGAKGSIWEGRPVDHMSVKPAHVVGFFASAAAAKAEAEAKAKAEAEAEANAPAAPESALDMLRMAGALLEKEGVDVSALRDLLPALNDALEVARANTAKPAPDAAKPAPVVGNTEDLSGLMGELSDGIA